MEPCARFDVCDTESEVRGLFRRGDSLSSDRAGLGKAIVVGLIVYVLCRILLYLASSWASVRHPWLLESRILWVAALLTVHLFPVACAIVEFRLNKVPNSPDIDPPEERDAVS